MVETVSFILVILTIYGVWWHLRGRKQSKLPQRKSFTSARVSIDIVPEPACHQFKIPSQGAMPPSVEPPAQKEKLVMRNLDTISFTIDMKALVRYALNDPACREEVYTAIREGANPNIEILGAANLNGEGEPDRWFSLFISTNQRIEAGTEGFISRNQDGTRISARLRRQVRKDHVAQDSDQMPTLVEADGTQLLTQALLTLKQNPKLLASLMGQPRAQVALPPESEFALDLKPEESDEPDSDVPF